MIYIKTRCDNAVYMIESGRWSSFCNGQLFYLFPVDKKEFESLCRHDSYVTDHYANEISDHDGIKITKKNVSGLVEYCLNMYLGEKAYYIMPAISAEILMSHYRIKEVFFIVHYVVGDGEENYTVFIRRTRMKACTREAMVTSGHAVISNSNFTHDQAYIDNMLHNKKILGTQREIEDVIKSLRLHDDFSVTIDNVRRLPVDVSCRKSYWGQSSRGSMYTKSKYSKRTNIIAGNKISVREPGYGDKDIKGIIRHPIDVLTDLRFPSIMITHKSARSVWGGLLLTNVTPALHLLHNNKNLFSAALESIFMSITKHIAYEKSRNIVIPSSNAHCLWLSDNLYHSIRDASGSAPLFGTGTVISMILQENNRGIYSRRLHSGNMIYYRVCPIMAGNFNHDDHPTFIAIISTKPIQETVV